MALQPLPSTPSFTPPRRQAADKTGFNKIYLQALQKLLVSGLTALPILGITYIQPARSSEVGL